MRTPSRYALFACGEPKAGTGDHKEEDPGDQEDRGERQRLEAGAGCGELVLVRRVVVAARLVVRGPVVVRGLFVRGLFFRSFALVRGLLLGGLRGRNRDDDSR